MELALELVGEECHTSSYSSTPSLVRVKELEKPEDRTREVSASLPS